MPVANKSIVTVRGGLGCIRLALMAIVLVLAGCSSSPVKITVTPKVASNQGQIGFGRTYVVEVHNPSQGQPIGKRSSGENSFFLVENDMALAVAEAVADGMNSMGYAPGHNTPDDIRLRIDITSLQYGAPVNASYTNKVEMNAKIAVRVDRGPDHFNGQYGTKGDKRFVLAPGPEQSSEAVSKMMSQALQNMFNDPAFINFLR
jgi:uncharacterized lipoprotein YajG